jgi:hypothetical protein
MALHIDGTTPHGELDGSATRGPWAVFDDVRQEWLIAGLRYRWMAALFIWRHNHTATDQKES